MGLRARRFRSDLDTCLMTVAFTLREVWQQRHNNLFDLESTGSEAHRTKFLCNHGVASSRSRLRRRSAVCTYKFGFRLEFASFVEEPELEFGNGRHIDIRFGLANYGALDARNELAPTKIRLGLVGDQKSIDQFRKWVEECRSGIDKKKTPLVTLFPAFPGFGDGKPLCDFIVADQMTRTIPARQIRALACVRPRDDLISQSVERFLSEGSDLYHNTTCDVVICLPPPDLLKPIDTGATVQYGPRSRRSQNTKEPHKTVWHDLLKAKAMRMPVRFRWFAQQPTGAKCIGIARMELRPTTLKTKHHERGIFSPGCTTRRAAFRGGCLAVRQTSTHASSVLVTSMKRQASPFKRVSHRYSTNVAKALSCEAGKHCYGKTTRRCTWIERLQRTCCVTPLPFIGANIAICLLASCATKVRTSTAARLLVSRTLSTRWESTSWTGCPCGSRRFASAETDRTRRCAGPPSRWMRRLHCSIRRGASISTARIQVCRCPVRLKCVLTGPTTNRIDFCRRFWH